MKKMDSYKVFKGGNKTGTPTPSFSMRYNAEDDELEQLIETPPAPPPPPPDMPSLIGETVSEGGTPNESRDSPVRVRGRGVKRSSSLDDPPPTTETWKFFTDIKGRITKTVEEKIEEIKSDRMKKKEKKKLITGGENSSVSDSEDKSEGSASQAASIGTGTANQQMSASQATSAKESDEEATETDISDSTPVRDLGPSMDFSTLRMRSSYSRKKKRASIEVAEEAFEVEDDDEDSRSGSVYATKPTSAKLDRVQHEKVEIGMLAKYWRHIGFVLIVAMFFAWAPLPEKVSWTCIGGLIVMALVHFNMLPFLRTDSSYSQENKVLFTGQFDIDSFHILPDQMRQLPSSDPEYFLHQGWMNEYDCEYNEKTYKLRDTSCIWLSLKGPLLTVSTPVHPPPHRAFWSEPRHPMIFTHHRLYNLVNCDVTLLPDGLTNKRKWSKKYPIYITLKEESYLGSSFKDPFEKDKNTINLDSFDPDTASEALDEVKKELHSSLKKKDRSASLDIGDPGEESDTEDEVGITFNDVQKSASVSALDDPEYCDFVHVTPNIVEKKLSLCLFARSDREKEIWFRKLVAAVGYSGPITNDTPVKEKLKTLKVCREKLNKSYLDFMYNLAQAMPRSNRRRRRRCKEGHTGSMWFNVFVSRIYYDYINNPVFMSIVQDRVQRKLSTVKLPGIVECLVVSRLVVEGPAPLIDGWTEPRLDSSGVWTDVDITYQGLTSITIDIQLNLTGKKKDSLPPSPRKGEVKVEEEKNSAAYHSSLEDSGESSTDSDDRSEQSATRKRSQSPSVVNRITHKYLNQVAENKLVRKALEGVSYNTHISLIVEIRALVGTLVINIPPPPTNRLWYGFRPKPKLYMKARPVLGDKVVSLVNITNWIEKRLYREFEKVLVLPNMDDIVIPHMDRNVPF